jgi:hypothetical protein
MSADNGVYILETLAPNSGKEYRVIHAQAIENIFYFNPERGYIQGDEGDDVELVLYFGNSEIFHSEDDAWHESLKMADEIENDDWGGYLEYGISAIRLNKVFPTMTQEEAKQKYDARWNSEKVTT